MSREQILTCAILAGLVALFLWDRLRYDLVAVLALLAAVALGAGSDFLSPVGHQSNTLVMRLGGYRLGDYWKLGLPLSMMVIALGVPLIMLFWPLH